MRLLLEIILAGALIALSWNKSFKEWASEAPIIGSHLTAPAQTPARNVKAPADRPADNKPKSFTGHITYLDEQGKTYWLDAQGVRHYER
jgi:hypothetical protein